MEESEATSPPNSNSNRTKKKSRSRSRQGEADHSEAAEHVEVEPTNQNKNVLANNAAINCCAPPPPRRSLAIFVLLCAAIALCAALWAGARESTSASSSVLAPIAASGFFASLVLALAYARCVRQRHDTAVLWDDDDTCGYSLARVGTPIALLAALLVGVYLLLLFSSPIDAGDDDDDDDGDGDGVPLRLIVPACCVVGALLYVALGVALTENDRRAGRTSAKEAEGYVPIIVGGLLLIGALPAFLGFSVAVIPASFDAADAALLIGFAVAVIALLCACLGLACVLYCMNHEDDENPI